MGIWDYHYRNYCSHGSAYFSIDVMVRPGPRVTANSFSIATVMLLTFSMVFLTLIVLLSADTKIALFNFPAGNKYITHTQKDTSTYQLHQGYVENGC